MRQVFAPRREFSPVGHGRKAHICEARDDRLGVLVPITAASGLVGE